MRFQFLRFLLVGGMFAGVNIALLVWLVGTLRVPYLWACVISFFALNLLSYALNKVFTFRLQPSLEGLELLRYYVVMAISLGTNLLLMWALVDLVGLHYVLASALVSITLALLNYLGHSRFTFGSALRHGTERGAAPLHVLQVSAFFPAHGGGIEVVAGRLAENLTRRGIRVTWMAGGSEAERPAGDGLLAIDQARSFDPLERRLGLPAPIWMPGSLLRLWGHVGRADVVHVHDYMYAPTLCAMLFAALRSRPVVLTQHIGEIPFKSKLPAAILRTLNRTLGRLVLSACQQVAFVGKPVLDYFAGFTRFRHPPLLVPNGVDHQVYRPGEGAGPEASLPLRCLFVGRFVEKKGVALLRECVDIPGIAWTFVGWGPLSPTDWPSASRPRVVSGVRGAEVVPHYQAADLLVLPSTGEGFPLVLQEALACGTPVLVSTEVREAFPHADPACVFDVELRGERPVAALRAALECRVIQRHELRRARDRAAELSAQWSWERCVDTYAVVYDRVAGRSSSVTDGFDQQAPVGG